MNFDPFWRHQELLAEAERERLLKDLPRRPGRHLQLRLRARLAHALFALATWLSPELSQPAPRFELARATRRNGRL